MKKMIIKNCPSITKLTKLCDNACPEVTMCKDITDCVMKRIVERCSLYLFNYPVNYAIQMLTQNINDMLEIEEVDEPKY